MMTITDGLVYTEEGTKAKRNTILIIIQLRDIIISSRPFHLSYYGHGHLGGIVATASRPLLSKTTQSVHNNEARSKDGRLSSCRVLVSP